MYDRVRGMSTRPIGDPFHILGTMVYNAGMVEIVESDTFKRWVRRLRDHSAVAKINARLRKVSIGNFGDTRPIGDGISEMRIHYGPGYRIYFIREGSKVVVLLCGGDKGSQQRDIEHAKRLAQDWR